MGQKEKIEKLFFENPSKYFYLREIGKLTKVPKTTVQRNLIELKKDNMVIKSKDKPYPRYVANTENFYYKYNKRNNIIKNLYKSGLIEYLIKELSPRTIILFGSCAKGEYNVKSDIDLYIESKENAIKTAKYEKILKHKINIFFAEEINTLNKELFNNIINGEKLYGFIKLR